MEQSPFWEASSLSDKFPTFCGTRRFVTLFTRTCHWSLFWARCTKSTPSHPVFCKNHFNIILPSMPGSQCMYTSRKYTSLHAICQSSDYALQEMKRASCSVCIQKWRSVSQQVITVTTSTSIFNSTHCLMVW